ncbi:DUF4269 domain-containing protein [Halobacillus kuroshimensis]|uniref:DUF4269 domain-containing protein n=1 Tax=Halobacillus kuroshimensis TaxID=302481 RepID=A0ABS3DS15_9BACI|nr:DUF4269 domain-containing protein [Halobacillus kuroshimensis]MBN8234138.1 DUF4269 domain-containing protein [Halobacillus kuroshimensis]
MNVMDLLRNGSEKQRHVLRLFQELNIAAQFKENHPVICGTIPLGIDLDESDVDVIMQAKDLSLLIKKWKCLYGDFSNFKTAEKYIRGRKIAKANFRYGGLEWELFAQNQPVTEQNAWLHMFIEYCILREDPSLKLIILQKKKDGFSTEAAFCDQLEIEGDPYEGLLAYGKKKGWI